MSCFHRVLIFIPVLLVFSLSSCGSVKRTQLKNAVDEAHEELSSGDFQKALDIYQLTYKKYPKNSEILKEYIETIESIKAQGDKAFNTQNYVQAQITYDLLLKNFPRFNDFANQLSFKENVLATRLRMSPMLQAEKEARLATKRRMSQMVQAEKQAQSFLKSGDFQKGIDIYRSLIQQYPSDTTVRNRYVSLLESIKAQADLSFKRKDFAPAGKTYRILFENYSSLGNLKQSLSYDAALLDLGIKICQKILYEEGLEHYRSGNLSQAIFIWKNILTFDPENLEVKKATDIATLQSGNLEKIKADDTK